MLGVPPCSSRCWICRDRQDQPGPRDSPGPATPILTSVVGPPARVAAAAAAAQAGAALVQAVGHQTWDGSSFRTVFGIMSSQQVFIQPGWESGAALSLFLLV